MEEVDILIAGAGPGGCTTAIELSRLGHSCLVLDKAEFPRDKICGDALSGKVLDTLRKIDPEMAVRLSAEPRHLDCWGVRFISPAGEPLDVPFRMDYREVAGKETAPGYIARRMDFDQFMFQEAKARPGVEMRTGTSVNGLQREGEGWIVETSAGPVKARFVVAADGAQSKLARLLTGREKDERHHSAAIRAYFRNVEGLHEDGFIELHYIKDVLPGYFWIFPLSDGGANVGLGMRSDQISDGKVNLKKELERVISTHPDIAPRFKNAELDGKILGFGLPLGSRRVQLSGDGFALIGDAGSLIDPFTGEGIGNAMISGRLAAVRISEGFAAENLSASFMKDYDAAVWRYLGDELKISTTLQRLATFPRLFNFVVRRANTNPTLRETISCMFEDMDLRDRLRKPGFWLRLLFGREQAARG